MKWIMVFLCVNGLWQISTQSSDFNINLRYSDCDTRYDLDDYNSIYFEYHGSKILFSNPCHVEFTKSSNKKIFCISAQEVSLDCQTELEYHEAFVKNYIDPEKTVTCYDSYVGEWCPSQYQDKIFVVIRKPETVSSDNIELRIYLRDAPDSSDGGVSSIIWIVSIAPAVIIAIGIVICVARMRARRMALAQRPQVVYQTTSGNVSMQTGYSATQQANQVYHPVQQPAPPQFQGNYNVHPMQSAYPMTQPHSATSAGLNPQQYPSAPSMNSVEAPPPSYDSVVGK